MSKINWMDKLGWNQDHIDDLRNTGFAYIRQGKYDIALPLFEALAVLNSESVYDMQTLGALYLQINNPVKAIQTIEKALKLEADHTPTLINLCKALFMLGKKEEGLRLAQILSNDKNPKISSIAKALILANS